MITRIEASKRHLAKYEWLKTYYLFSFSNYFDPANLQFGVLRVFNDDTINAYSGFDEHGHDNMEIVTLVLEGALTHRDSMGNKEVIKAGEVQRMSAGTGVIHAEKNLGDEPVHLFQLWFMPEQDGLTPSYEQKDFSYTEKNKLVPIISNKAQEDVMRLSADVTLFLADMEAGAQQVYRPEVGRGVFMYVQQGELLLNGTKFSAGDQARIVDESELTLQVEGDAKFVWIDVGGV
jgi:redox-sensitive bicupin YhaK (pirin superfamily)